MKAVMIKKEGGNNIYHAHTESGRGAYLCDIGLFSHIYLLEKKRKQYREEDCFLVQLEIELEQNSKLMEPAGDQLMKTLKRRLRRGDVVCRWKQDLFLLLLHEVDYVQVEGIIKRIRHFYNHSPVLCRRKSCWFNCEAECQLDKFTPSSLPFCFSPESRINVRLKWDIYKI